MVSFICRLVRLLAGVNIKWMDASKHDLNFRQADEETGASSGLQVRF